MRRNLTEHDDSSQNHNTDGPDSNADSTSKGPDPFQQMRAFEDDGAAMKRQLSIASFQNLSLNDCNSICDSQFSHYNPSVNEIFIPEEADEDERAIHEFLTMAGVKSINVKQQLEQEKSSYSANSSAKRLSFMANKKQSPSFLLRRMRLDSTAGSSSGGA